MLGRAGATDVQFETEPWSRPEMFWTVRKDREVTGPGNVLSIPERLKTVWRVVRRYGWGSVRTALRNERRILQTVVEGKLGYGIYWAQRP